MHPGNELPISYIEIDLEEYLSTTSCNKSLNDIKHYYLKCLALFLCNIHGHLHVSTLEN